MPERVDRYVSGAVVTRACATVPAGRQNSTMGVYGASKSTEPNREGVS